jgi:signal transduction histidine kinase/ActR/RegA family two-component response regulator
MMRTQTSFDETETSVRMKAALTGLFINRGLWAGVMLAGGGATILAGAWLWGAMVLVCAAPMHFAAKPVRQWLEHRIPTLSPLRFDLYFGGMLFGASLLHHGVLAMALHTAPSPTMAVVAAGSALCMVALGAQRLGARPLVYIAHATPAALLLAFVLAPTLATASLAQGLALFLIIGLTVMTLVTLFAGAYHAQLRFGALRTKRKLLLEQLRTQNASAQEDKLRLEMALASARAAAWDIDFIERKVINSAAIEHVLGRDFTFAEFTAGALVDLVHPDDRDLVMREMKLLRYSPCHRVSEHRIVHPAGERWVESSALSTADENGKVRRVLVLTRDITDRKHAEQELLRAKARAEAASVAKSQFLATMSHEIRTPMNGVLGMAQILQRSTLTAEQRAQVNVLIDSGESLMALLNDILDLSKIEAGRMDITPAPTAISEVMLAAQRFWGPNAAEKGLTLKLEIPDSAPAVMLDALRLRQILFNLISNAVKFTPRGAITLALSTRPEGPGRHQIVLSVKDTGIGMSDAQKQKLFQKFIQADAATTRLFGGSGLGLVISQSLAQLMGGRITVETALGSGSVFTFTATLQEAAAFLPQEPSRETAPADSSKPLCILAVDDHLVNRSIITTILGQLGHDIDLAEDGAQGVAMAATRAYDVILMDIQMPVLDGERAFAAIRAGGGPNADTPIIALTANAMAHDRERYMLQGFCDHVPKPIDLRALAGAITAAALMRAVSKAA